MSTKHQSRHEAISERIDLELRSRERRNVSARKNSIRVRQFSTAIGLTFRMIYSRRWKKICFVERKYDVFRRGPFPFRLQENFFYHKHTWRRFLLRKMLRSHELNYARLDLRKNLFSEQIGTTTTKIDQSSSKIAFLCDKSSIIRWLPSLDFFG